MSEAIVLRTWVVGTKPVLQTLKMVDKELYKQVEKEIKYIAEPVRRRIADSFPDKPMGKWVLYGRTARGRKPRDQSGPTFPKYDISKVRRGVSVQVGGRKVRRTNSYPIMRIRQADAGAVIYDLAKHTRTPGKEQFIKNLDRSGSPSRRMWKKTEELFPLIRGRIMDVVERIGGQFSERILREENLREMARIRAGQQRRNAITGRFGA